MAKEKNIKHYRRCDRCGLYPKSYDGIMVYAKANNLTKVQFEDKENGDFEVRVSNIYKMKELTLQNK